MTEQEALAHVATVYEGSDGDATKALYSRLEQLGPAGIIALNLLRAQKNSERAKVYRGGGYRRMAYDRKQWAMGNLAEQLTVHADACNIVWGWGTDPEQPMHNVILYIQLDTGQVSFHTDTRGAGPDFPDTWDGVRNASPSRVCRHVAKLLAQADV